MSSTPCLPGLFTPAEEPRKKPNPVVKELQRRSRNADRLLARLRQGPATTLEIIAVAGCRAPARAWELRQQGFEISVEHIDGGLYRYSLRQERS